MKSMRILTAISGLALAAVAGDFAIESFSGTGRLSFGELPDATSYQVEWAPTPAGPWKNFSNDVANLCALLATGQGSVTCSVPMCYRVVATLMPAVPMAFNLSGGGATTDVGVVTLDHAFTGRPTHYLASENADFAGATWRVWTGSPAYALSAGDGVKTVYFKLRNAANEESGVISDTITLSMPVDVTFFALNNGAAMTTNLSVTLNNACSGTPAYYLASEDPAFEGASWQTYSVTPGFLLSAGSASKTVYFKVSNRYGLLSPTFSDAIAYIEPIPPSIAQQPQSVTTFVGSNVAFSVTAVGAVPLSYQWRKGGTNLTDAARASGAASAQLTLSTIDSRDAGSYDVVVSNAFGCVTSQVAVLTVAMDYLVVDVTGGPTASVYPVSHLTSAPADGWTDEHKTTKIVFRCIPAGTFNMGSPAGELGRVSNEALHQVTLSQDFYVGVFEVTQKQWERVMGTWPGFFNNITYRDARPVERVSYNDVRGAGAGTNWPASSGVDTASFMGLLRAKTGQAFDLPTESQWEYACRAGTTTALNSGYNLASTSSDARMAEVGRYWSNGGGGYTQGGNTSVGSAKTGSYLPNAWGLYDMHGNVWEWCLDWDGIYPGTVTDPKGASSGSDRVFRGGSLDLSAYYCRSAYRNGITPDYATFTIGFRIALLPSSPMITQSPQSATAYVGSNVTFSVTAAGTAPLSYQWQFNSTNLEWATSSGLTLTNIQTANAGNYRALISNAYGSVTSAVAVLTVLGKYLVVDLSGGTNAATYPVSHLAEVPVGGWTDEHKTTKLVLRKIPATAPDFTMGKWSTDFPGAIDIDLHQVTLTKGFYIGVFEVTQRQWERVLGTWPSYFNNADYRDARPVEQVSYNAIRGAFAGADWPANNSVDASSFLGLLRAKTGMTFDLPTESQWEYACRAGTATALNSGYNLTNTTSDAHMAEVGRYYYNGGNGYTQGGDTSVGSAKVGSFLPNAWGLYDMHGNVWEWCLDWLWFYEGTFTDPKGASSGSYRIARGGGSLSHAGDCRSGGRYNVTPGGFTFGGGFRLTLPSGQP